MVSSLHLFLLSIAFALILGADALPKILKPRAFLLSIKRDEATLQYYTEIEIGEPRVVKNLVIDLGGQSLWFDCDNNDYNSSTYRPVRCGSSKCKVAKGSGCLGCNGPPRPGCTNNTCALSPFNPFNDSLSVGGLGEDTMAIYSTDGLNYLIHVDVPKVPFVCTGAFQLP